MAMVYSPNWANGIAPGIKDAFYTGVTEKPMMSQQIFNVMTSDKAYEKDLAAYGAGIWEENPGGEPLMKDEPGELATVQYTHGEFRKGISVTQTLIEDDLYNLITDRAKLLGRGAHAKVETDSSDIFNNSFSGGATAPDGSQLISDSRALANSSSTADNKGTAAFDAGALEDGLEAMMEQVDDANIKINARARILLVPPALYFPAKRVVGSTNQAGTANNDINAIADEGLMVIGWSYLTDSAAWFLIDPSVAKLKFYWRIALNFNETYDPNTESMLYRGRMRYAVGFSDWRGVWGSNGTT